jgi:hypothetical protein
MGGGTVSTETSGNARWEIAADADERAVLTGFLEFQRDALVRKCDGLTDEQLRLRPVATSALSLIGLVRHLATVERWYFQGVVADAFPGSLYDHESNAAWLDTHTATKADSFATWAGEVAAARRVTEQHPLDAVAVIPSTGHQVSLRWVLTHMIDEYARHLGHADLVRELIDGLTGE